MAEQGEKCSLRSAHEFSFATGVACFIRFAFIASLT
jgi:hypothetical protein